MKLSQLFNGQPPALVMYDLDGTLVDSVPDLAISIDKMLEDLGRPVAGIDKVRLWVGNGIPVMVKRAIADDMNGHQPGRVDQQLFEKGYERFKHHYAIEIGQHSHVYPGVMDFLETMNNQGVKQAIVTNKSEFFTEKLLQLMKIDHFFELSIGGDSLAEKKPHPMPLLHVMKHCGATTENSLMVGDSSNDIKAAKAAGVKVIGLPYGYNHGQPIEASNPDLVVKTLSELICSVSD
ncbi:phosphoglycolate phosphatase [Endozoicomonas sp. Mp262]|uniref:phosphoglycolate phosphatase n=1 Tax=Endozoicomonas sp. Mp262 TaxID=2919499 RepID=UPI0021D94DAE